MLRIADAKRRCGAVRGLYTFMLIDGPAAASPLKQRFALRRGLYVFGLVRGGVDVIAGATSVRKHCVVDSIVLHSEP